MDFFNNILSFSLEDLPYVVISVVLAFTVHEFAHAYVAYKFGDHTAKNQGRLTLNPIHHIDPIGMILILLAGFGWARPVPVNRYFFKHPRLAGILVSFAGPLSNFVLAICAYFVLYGMASLGFGPAMPGFLVTFLEMFIYYNVLLFIFNLIPLPPLDGYRIIEDLAPVHVRAKMTQYEQYGTLIFLILVLVPPLGAVTIYPILNTLIPGIIIGLHDLFNIVFLR
ncbi:MAG: site-2 protease family protein [Bacillus sp. (in: firmicutes)]